MHRSRPHIAVRDLRIGWGARVLMENVTFDIERGTTFVILGGSGCGKSTLLRHLIGLERPQSGVIEIDGLGPPHSYEGVPRFGVLFQSGALFGSLTLAENLALPLTTWTSVRGRPVQEPRILRDQSTIPFVHCFFTRSSAALTASHGV